MPQRRSHTIVYMKMTERLSENVFFAKDRIRFYGTEGVLQKACLSTSTQRMFSVRIWMNWYFNTQDSGTFRFRSPSGQF